MLKTLLFLSPMIVTFIYALIGSFFMWYWHTGGLFVFLPTLIVYSVSVIFYFLAIKKQQNKFYYLFVIVFSSLLLGMLLYYIISILIHPLGILGLLLFILPSSPFIIYNIVIFVLFVNKKHYIQGYV